MARDYQQIAHDYAQSVIDGDIIACKQTRQACERYFRDLEREGTDEFPYYYNVPVVKNGKEVNPIEHCCFFLETMKHIQGPLAGQRLELQPFQIFAVAQIMGWINEHGLRRFRSVYFTLARKNGKSFLLAGISLYMLLADGEAGAGVYSAAVAREQARLIWEVAQHQVQNNKEMRDYFGVKAHANSIFVEKTASKFLALASDSKSLDGLNISFAAIDELHAHPNRKVYDVVETATGSRAQPMVFVITTAGDNHAGICFELQTYCEKVLDRSLDDESVFALIYTLDEGDKEKIFVQPELMAKANPNLGVSVLEDDLHRLWLKAKGTPSAVNNFLVKRVNVWVANTAGYLDMEKYNALHDPDLRIEDFEGEDCFMGSDLASKDDLAALLWLFKRDGVVYPFAKFYIPELVAKNHPNDMFHGWIDKGWITVTPGDIIDFNWIERDAEQSRKMFEVKEWGYDPYQATQFAANLVADGWPMVEVKQTAMQLSEPLKELHARVIAGTISHNNPVLAWMMGNVTAVEDYNRNVFPRKAGATATNKRGDPTKKIDGVIAFLCAMHRMISPQEDESSVYETQELRIL